MEMRKYIAILLMFVCGVPGLVWGRCDSGVNYQNSDCAWPETDYYTTISQCYTASNKDSCTANCMDTYSPTNGCYCFYSNNGCTDKRISVTFEDVYGPNSAPVTYYYNCYGIYNAKCDNDNDCYYTHDDNKPVSLPMPTPSSKLYTFDGFLETDTDTPSTARNHKELIYILKSMCLSSNSGDTQNKNFKLQTKWESKKRTVNYQLSTGAYLSLSETITINANKTSYTPLNFSKLKEICSGLNVYGDTAPQNLYYKYGNQTHYLNAATAPNGGHSAFFSISPGTDAITIVLYGTCPENYYCPSNNFCNAKSCADASKFSGLPYKDLYNFVSDDGATSENECQAELKNNITFIDNNGSFVIQ